ncbi:type I-C CRISPR-associated protein Cas5c [Endozoicomonadaceae bacterium StTr2]
MSRRHHVTLKVWGDYACFTNPAFSVDRWSYPVMTPTAARGIFNAIYSHPELYWVISQINVLRPIRWRGFSTNEVEQCIRKRDINKLLSDDYQGDVMVTDEMRIQCHNLILKDVAYVIHAHATLLPPYRSNPKLTEVEHKAMFQERVRNGQCSFPPWMGKRDYLANFDEASPADKPIDVSERIGMLPLEILNKKTGPQPVFFEAFMKQGKIRAPRVKAVLSCC